MSEEKKHGIKETKEVVAISFRIASKIKEIARGGLQASDLMIIVGEVKEMELYIEAFSDLDKVDDEIKDLDEQEAVELLLAVIAGVKEFRKA